MAIRILRIGNTGPVMDHQYLLNNDLKDQHPITAIIGLEKALERIYEPNKNEYVFDNLHTNPECIFTDNIIKNTNGLYLMPDMTADDTLIDANEYNLETTSLYHCECDLFAVDLSVTGNRGITGGIDKLFTDGVCDISTNGVTTVTATFFDVTYISKLRFIAPNFKGQIISTDYDDNDAIELEITEDDNTVTINKFVKSIKFVYTVSSSVSFLLDTLELYSIEKMYAHIETSSTIGKTIPDAVELINRKDFNNFVDTHSKIESCVYSDTSKNTTIRFYTEVNSFCLTKVDSFKILYSIYNGETVKQLSNYIDELEGQIVDIKSFIDGIDLGTSEIAKLSENVVKNKDNIALNKKAIIDAGTYKDDTGTIHENLTDRINYIEEIARDKNRNLRDITLDSPIHYKLFDVKEPTTEFELPFNYPPNKHQLKVYVDGAKAECGENQDYLELSFNKIKFNYELNNCEVVCEIPSSINLSKKILNKKYEYDNKGRISSIIISGDEDKKITYHYEKDKKIEIIETEFEKIQTTYIYKDDKLIETIGEVQNYLGEVKAMIPTVIRIKEHIDLKPYEKKTITVDTNGCICFNVKSVYIKSDKDNIFNFKITQTDDDFVPYELEGVRTRLYELVSFVYCNENKKGTIEFEIENKFNSYVSYDIRIDAIELKID